MKTTTSPALRLLADYGVTAPVAITAELQASKAAMLDWAGRDGKYSIGDLEAVLQGHGESLETWGDACEAEIRPHIYRSAEAVLSWLGY
jgi:hypothetical protein